MIRWIGRALFILAFAMLYYSYYIYFSYIYKNPPFPQYIAPLIGIAAGFLVIFLDILYRDRIARNFLAVFIGLLIGIFFSGQVLVFLERFMLVYSGTEMDAVSREGLMKSVIVPLIPVVYLIVCYMSVTVTLHAKESMKFIIPFVSIKDESRQTGGLILDSSVLIDGRIIDLCRSKIIDSKIIIPRFVVSELQMIADSDNKLKRLRGRRGLDVVKQLQGIREVDTEISDDDFQGAGFVDEKLVKLAAKKNARVVSNDFNLNKVADIHGVEVVNINNIANALKVNVIVGETIDVEVLKEGDGANQGVGYLPDGTMVVIDGAKRLVGSVVSAVVTNIYKKDAGRIVFARLTDNG